MVKPEKFGHLHVVFHFIVPLRIVELETVKKTKVL